MPVITLYRDDFVRLSDGSSAFDLFLDDVPDPQSVREIIIEVHEDVEVITRES